MERPPPENSAGDLRRRIRPETSAGGFGCRTPAPRVLDATSGSMATSLARRVRLPIGTAARFLCAKAKPNPTALCKTTHGDFKVELYVDQMPVTASNFADLAKNHFYDGLHFHRVIPHFMAQL